MYGIVLSLFGSKLMTFFKMGYCFSKAFLGYLGGICLTNVAGDDYKISLHFITSITLPEREA